MLENAHIQLVCWVSTFILQIWSSEHNLLIQIEYIKILTFLLRQITIFKMLKKSHVEDPFPSLWRFWQNFVKK
jgi:hypothetical protein